MDLENTYDKIDREALWQLLSVYGVGGGLSAATKAFYKESESCVKVEGMVSE